MSTEIELKKLTVAQLKASCKEKRITGYSKLGKDALIQKLLGTPNTQPATPAAASHSSESQTPSTPTVHVEGPSLSPIQNPPSSEIPSESASKPRPKKRKTPAASSESLAASDVFKVPAIPQRLVHEPPLPPVLPALSESASASSAPKKKKKKVTANPPIIDPAASDPTSPSTFASQKKTTADDIPTPSTTNTSSASKKAKKSTAEAATHVAADNTAPASKNSDIAPPSTTSASKKRKADPQGSSTSSASKKSKNSTVEPATNGAADNITASTIAVAKKRKTITPTSPSPPTVDTIPSVPTVLKRPSTLPPIDPPPAKKPKVSSPHPSKPPVASKFVLPEMMTPTTSAAVQYPVLAQDAVKQPQVPPKVAQKRFVPLVVRANKLAISALVVAPLPSSSTIPTVSQSSLVETLYHLDFPPSPSTISLPTITLPPSLSQRKRVPRFALLLSFVADEDLRNCVLVSRLFRYAVYLSASHRLARLFAGKRLSAMLAKYSQAMTNMWPYLEHRRHELSARKQRYTSSFLGRLFPSGANNLISEHLWTSPDHERQIVIALRFLLTRLFFQVSVGGGKDGKGWTEGQIVDAQQLVQDEVWSITVRQSAGLTESFYVLESTCEPLTATADSASPGIPVRADWAAYIAHRALMHTSPTPRLLDYLSWTNKEEYVLGISRLWLKRIEGEGETGKAKRLTAERYILSCVVGNSLSGQWMSSTQMAQNFAGLPEGVPARVQASPKVNLFLPAHHHVESLHFTTSMRRAVHSALAIVQTPGREYFILKDNGMQVGCEEDGVAEVWMKILGCDNAGVALGL